MSKIYFVTIILFLFSCTKEIEIEIPKEKHKLVAYSTIVPLTFPYPKALGIKLQSSKHIFDTTASIIDDAQILYYENEVLKDTLKYVDSIGVYVISESMSDYPIKNNSYSIQVIKEGYEIITANTTIPSKVNITDTVITSIAYFDETGSVFSEIAITFTDPVNETNYYEIAVSDIAFTYDNSTNFYELSTNDNIITSESYYPSLMRFDVDKPKYLLFTDKEINGKEHILNVYYKPPRNLHENGSEYISDHYISIHLRNITEEYYKFKTTMIQHLYSKQEDILYGMGEPLNVKSNIKNGYGLFAGFNNDIVSFHFDEQIISE